MAASRLPCPQCGTLNYAQDAQCLGCGCRFAPAAPAPAAARKPEQYAPDETCTRCYGVLLPAAQFDTSGLAGGIDSSVGGGGYGGTLGRDARAIGGALNFMDMIAHMLLGSIQAKMFQRRLHRTLQEAPHSLCCPSCRNIVRR